MSDKKLDSNKEIEDLFSAGVHFGYSKRRWDPRVSPFVYCFKNKRAVIDLEKTAKAIQEAESFIAGIVSSGGQVLWVGNKPEAREAIVQAAGYTDMPYVALRWIGGTFTNFLQIKERIDKLFDIKEKEATGELSKYTKKERLSISKDKIDLERYYGGLGNMKSLPQAVVIVDPAEEHVAVAEALKKNIPIVAIANTDCNTKPIDYPIIANDNQKSSIKLIIDRLAEACIAGKSSQYEAPEIENGTDEEGKNKDQENRHEARVQAGLVK